MGFHSDKYRVRATYDQGLVLWCTRCNRTYRWDDAGAGLDEFLIWADTHEAVWHKEDQ